MSVKPKAELLALAAEETLSRIRRDREGVPKKLAPLLAYIEQHLFDPELDVNSLKRACEVRNNTTMVQFRAKLGVTPHLYIKARRAEVAKKLLRDTQLRVSDVAALLGYSGTRAFSRAFKRVSPQLPSDYRAQFRQQAGAPMAAKDLESLEVWRKGHAGELEMHEAVALVEHFQKLYSLETSVMPVPVPIDGEDFERFSAQQVWRAIADQPMAAQLATVRLQIRFTTPALFDLLRQKSREEGRRNRQRGVQLAEVAIASLEGSAAALGEKVADLKARGWAWLGNARRQVGDFSGAEEAFALADAVWASPRGQKEARVEGEIFLFKACLRLYQRRFNEALNLDSQAIAVFKATGSLSELAQTLIVRANINGYSGAADAAVPDLIEAIQLLDGQEDRFLRLSAYVNLAAIYTLLDRHSLASELLPQAKKLCAATGSRLVRHQLQWVEALTRSGNGNLRGAELLLKSAQSGFAAISEADYAAVVSLDLAMLYGQQNRHREAVAVASLAIPAFQALRLDKEAVVALDVLTQAIQADVIPNDVLRQARSLLIRSQLFPLSKVG